MIYSIKVGLFQKIMVLLKRNNVFWNQQIQQSNNPTIFGTFRVRPQGQLSRIQDHPKTIENSWIVGLLDSPAVAAALLVRALAVRATASTPAEEDSDYSTFF